MALNHLLGRGMISVRYIISEIDNTDKIYLISEIDILMQKRSHNKVQQHKLWNHRNKKHTMYMSTKGSFACKDCVEYIHKPSAAHDSQEPAIQSQLSLIVNPTSPMWSIIWDLKMVNIHVGKSKLCSPQKKETPLSYLLTQVKTHPFTEIRTWAVESYKPTVGQGCAGCSKPVTY